MTVMTAASDVKATCLVHTAFDANVTWLMDGLGSTNSRVTRSTNSTHVISNVKVSSSQWKQLKFITCRAEHKCFLSTERKMSVAGKMTVKHENGMFCHIEGLERHLCCCLSVSSRTCSYSSISGDQEISSRFTEGKQRCVGV